MNEKGPMDQLSAHLDRAWDLVGRSDFPGAMSSAQKSLELNPGSPEVHNLMGYIRAQEGRAEDALSYFERAIELDDSFVEAMLNAAEVNIHPLHDWDEAIRLIDEALDWVGEVDEQADAMLLKVDALLGKGEHDEARKVALAVPEGPFENLATALALGRALYDVGELARAEPWLRQVLRAEPHNAEAHYLLGLSLVDRDLQAASICFLQTREADRREAIKPMLTREQFERRVQAAMLKLSSTAARIVDGALVVIDDLPGVEVVADGTDPRIPVMLDDIENENGLARARRIFVYQLNVERRVDSPLEVDDEIARSIQGEIEHHFPNLPASIPLGETH